jgi:hypothetical protein
MIGSCEVDDGNVAIELVKNLEPYDLLRLKEVAERYVITTCLVESTALPLLSLAYKHKATIMKVI